MWNHLFGNFRALFRDFVLGLPAELFPAWGLTAAAAGVADASFEVAALSKNVTAAAPGGPATLYVGF